MTVSRKFQILQLRQFPIINSNNSSIEEQIIRINQKYCGKPICKFLYVYLHGEQETKANLHFRSFTQLSEALNRTMVLTNVGHSRIEACKPFTFDFYYNVKKLKEEFPNVKFIEQSKFLNWVEERNLVNVPPDAEKIPLQLTIDHYQMFLNGNHKKSILYHEVNPNIQSFIEQGCFNLVKGLDLTDKKTLEKITFQYLNMSGKDVKRPEARKKFSQFLIKSFDTDSDIMLIKHKIGEPLFPKVMPIIPYADHIIKESYKIRKKLLPKYIAIHWRMEQAIPELLPQCAKNLVETIKLLFNVTDIKNVYLATDYPLLANSSQSSTFRDLTEYHKSAMKILKENINFNTWVSLDGLKKLREDGMHDEEFLGAGLQGILDKLVCVHSNYFISGPSGCSRVLSTFTRTIAQLRESMKKGGDVSLQNVILRWKPPKIEKINRSAKRQKLGNPMFTNILEVALSLRKALPESLRDNIMEEEQEESTSINANLIQHPDGKPLAAIKEHILYVRESYTDLYHIVTNENCDPCSLYLAPDGNLLYCFTDSNLFVGKFEEFSEQLYNSKTWYLVDDTVPKDVLERTVVSASSKRIKDRGFKEFIKNLMNKFCMPLWSIEELEACRLSAFPVIPQDLMLDLSDELGGVPRYVLQIPAYIICQESPNFEDQPFVLNNWDVIKKRSLECVKEALSEISDFKFIQCFSINAQYVEFTLFISGQTLSTESNPSRGPLVIFLIKFRKYWKIVNRPTIRNFGVVDLIFTLNCIFQVTVFQKHLVKQSELIKIVHIFYRAR
ncbi:6870_t:CDS:2 [Diversispora eburnea]|uniref:6870_t:CDS:1 n=1 Tax=Diversispora eburnea TaxID=1213867 RepID=A0A9N8V1S3_9GLOM|nr:6870_t:CDS:2 [Diversispora eburnea]